MRQLCGIEISFHQTVAGRKCEPTVEHRSERMESGQDCVYCKLFRGFVGVQRDSVSNVKPRCVCLPVIVSNINHISEREGIDGFKGNPCLDKHLNPKEDQKEAQPLQDEARENVNTGELDNIRLLIVLPLSAKWFICVLKLISTCSS